MTKPKPKPKRSRPTRRPTTVSTVLTLNPNPLSYLDGWFDGEGCQRICTAGAARVLRMSSKWPDKTQARITASRTERTGKGWRKLLLTRWYDDLDVSAPSRPADCEGASWWLIDLLLKILDKPHCHTCFCGDSVSSVPFWVKAERLKGAE